MASIEGNMELLKYGKGPAADHAEEHIPYEFIEKCNFEQNMLQVEDRVWAVKLKRYVYPKLGNRQAHAKLECPQAATEFFDYHGKINQSFDVDSIPAKKSCLGLNKIKDRLVELEEMPLVAMSKGRQLAFGAKLPILCLKYSPPLSHELPCSEKKEKEEFISNVTGASKKRAAKHNSP
ncbi:hypothetical protein CCACVL1_28814 [Corchorus capsularis]|uniref:Uncharacterized protein n=1 Tax=Corchorus capsularis TaxID=210143 RepID=A0A1R3G527_COCAP|nr:hypothetical protein CCACVL1_28814 [Corchorus capsularis]